MFGKRNGIHSSGWHHIALACVFAVGLNGSPLASSEKITDQSISDQVEDELLFDQGVMSRKVDVHTTKGVVSLKGEVNNLLARERAARIARTVRGVRSVINQIEVLPLINRTDEEIEGNIETAWRTDPAADSYEIRANVDDGTASLTGTVQSWQEKRLAAKLAAGVSGVRGIDNQITVDYRRDRPDVEIQKEIEQALAWNVYVPYGKLVTVDVNGGEVTLTASVGSAAEKDRIAETAWVAGVNAIDTSGVKVRDWLEDGERRLVQTPDVDDKKLKGAVKDALLYDPRVKLYDVDVDVYGGRVTLRGTVGSLKAKRAAAQDARNTYGVWHVYNRLKVQSASELSDPQIEERIEAAFARDPYVESYEVGIDVNVGVVDLHGAVDTWFEKSQAEDIASRIDGVLFVDNQLQVNSDFAPYLYDPYVDEINPYDYEWYHYEPNATFASDQEIRREIKDELWWSPFVDADQVMVSVTDGVATLTGKVDSASERQSAFENAVEGGATMVVNNLSIN